MKEHLPQLFNEAVYFAMTRCRRLCPGPGPGQAHASVHSLSTDQKHGTHFGTGCAGAGYILSRLISPSFLTSPK